MADLVAFDWLIRREGIFGCMPVGVGRCREGGHFGYMPDGAGRVRTLCVYVSLSVCLSVCASVRPYACSSVRSSQGISINRNVRVRTY